MVSDRHGIGRIVDLIVHLFVVFDPSETVVMRSCIEQHQVPPFLKKHETVPAAEVIFPTVLRPVFPVAGEPELLTQALILRAGDQTDQLIRFLGNL